MYRNFIQRGGCKKETILGSGCGSVGRTVTSNNRDLRSVTILGDLLDFGQLLPSAPINLPKSTSLLGNFVQVSKSIIFLLKSFFVQLLQTFGDFYLVTLDLRYESSHQQILFSVNWQTLFDQLQQEQKRISFS